jgi:hypothetical protein
MVDRARHARRLHHLLRQSSGAVVGVLQAGKTTLAHALATWVQRPA